MKKQLIHFTAMACMMLSFFACQPEQEVPTYDLVVYGGNSAGVIAANSAKKLGKSVLVIEPSKHLGGLSASGLGSTDIGNKHAVVGLSRDFYRRLGKFYREFEAWEFAPKDAEQVFKDYIAEVGAEVWFEYRVISVEKNADGFITSITVENAQNIQETKTVKGKIFMDCSYEGDVLARAGVSYHVGREDNSVYGETINGVQVMEGHQFEDGISPYKIADDSTSGLLWGISAETLSPDGTGDKKVQAYNFRLTWTRDSTNRVPFADLKPDDYNAEKYELLLRLMQEREKKGIAQTPKNYFLINSMPNKKTDTNNMGAFSTDMIGENYDYPEADYATRAQIAKKHENYIRGLCYFVATDPRINPELQQALNQYGWCKDEFLDNNHFPHQLYVREARRMIGEYVMTEANRRGTQVVEGGIGLAAYTMDSHNCQRVVIRKDGKAMVKNEGNVEVGGFHPYPIAYRSLLPKRTECKNLLVPVCLSASHIAYGSIRMEPVFMVMAQVSAIAASLAIDQNKTIHEIDYKEINAIMEANPLLDGTLPDVLVDNADRQQVETVGTWLDTAKFMG